MGGILIGLTLSTLMQASIDKSWKGTQYVIDMINEHYRLSERIPACLNFPPLCYTGTPGWQSTAHQLDANFPHQIQQELFCTTLYVNIVVFSEIFFHASSPRIFCWISTHPPNHKTRATAVRDTWGRKCDKILFGSNENDPSLPAINVTEKSNYDGLWAKTKAAFRILYEKHR